MPLRIFYLCSILLVILAGETVAQTAAPSSAMPCASVLLSNAQAAQGGSARSLLPCATPRFIVPTEFATGDSPQRIVSADFNQDGKPDMALNNRTPERLVVHLGDGAGGFGAPLNSPFVGNITEMGVADFNNDAIPDVVATTFSPSNNIAVLLGTGNGTMGAVILSSVQSGAGSFAAADFNNDTKTDLIVGGGAPGSVSLLLGTGNGTFAAPVTLSNPQSNLNPKSIVAADFNNDGKMDFATIGNFSNSVWVFTGTGTGSFNAPVNTTNLPDLGILAGGDFNEDGKVDLATIDPTGGGFSNINNVRIMLGNGMGGFAPQTTFIVNYLPRYLFVRDLNGDGHLDIATTSGNSGDIALLAGNGAGGFAPAIYFSLINPVALAAADFNTDGRVDLVAPSVDGATSVNSVALLLGEEEGIFRAARNHAVGFNPVYLLSGDTNNDGYLDLISVSSGASVAVTQGSISVLLGRSDGYFNAANDFSAGLRPVGAAPADFNRDGKLDVAVANAADGFIGPTASSISILLGNELGGFSLSGDIPVGISLKAITTGDFNADNNPDFAIATISSSTQSAVSMFLGNGLGGFAAPLNTSFSGFPSALVSKDYNGDGKLDLIVTTGRLDCGTTTGSVILLPGTGTGSFDPALVLNTGFSAVSVAPADYNGDGRIDLAVAKTCAAPDGVAVWINDGAGGFTGPTEFAVAGNRPRAIQTADINNDHKLDLLLAVQSTNSLAVLTGNGDGSFASARYFKTGYSPFHLVTGDYNRDHATDIAVVNYTTGSLSVMLNDCRLRRVNYFDFDGDGKADVSVFRPSEGTWYLSQSAAGFRAAQFGQSGDKIVPADYDGDDKADIAVFRPSNGYWYILNSADNSIRTAQFGQSGDTPAAGDFEGDGRADLAVFRPSTGTFYFMYSSDNSFHYQAWGTDGDVPLTGDYDADGKTDIAVFRPSSTSFYVLRSSDGQIVSQQWGASGDVPIAADFDGDGKTDIGIYRPTAGAWYYLQSSDNAFRGLAWGASGDVPVAADYDGDGRADVAVFRPATGVFYILQSTTNALRAEQFGTNGDVPVPSAYVP